MKINVSEQAAKWYKEELDLENEANVRFFARYGGVGGRVAGFSVGIREEAPEQIHAETNVEGVHFFVEESDAWYFDNSTLSVSYNEKRNEPQIEYLENTDG